MAKHDVIKSQHPVELGHKGRLGRELDKDVVALAAVLELVREGPAAPPLGAAGVAPAVTHQRCDAIETGVDVAVFEADIEDNHDFVGPHCGLTSSGPGALERSGPRVSTGQGYRGHRHGSRGRPNAAQVGESIHLREHGRRV